MSACPIFRLPYLALKPCLDLMEFPDLVTIAVCSDRMRRTIRLYRPFPSFQKLWREQHADVNFVELLQHHLLEIPISEFNQKVISYSINLTNLIPEFYISFRASPNRTLECRLRILAQNSGPEEPALNAEIQLIRQKIANQMPGKGGAPGFTTSSQKELKFYGKVVEFCHPHRSMTLSTVWESAVEGVVIVMKYFKEVFGLKISDLKIDTTSGSIDVMREAISILNSTYETVENLEVTTRDYDYDAIEIALDNLNASKSYKFHLKSDSNFKLVRYFQADSFEMGSSSWFSLENLLLTECGTIKLMDSRLTNLDMNEFLKKWLDGECSEVRELKVQMMEKLDGKVVVEGLSDKYIVVREDNKIRIEREDGVIAELKTPPNGEKTNWFEMKVIMDN